MMREDFDNPWENYYSKKEKIRKNDSLLDEWVYSPSRNSRGPLEHIIAAKAIAFEECMS